MWNSAVLDVGIGLALMYLLLALVCSVVQELIANITSWRGRHLLTSIKTMLNDPNLTGLAKRVYADPRINQLTLPGKLPSYIPPAAFAKALADIVADEKGMTSSVFDGPLAPFLREAQGDADKLKAALEQWYDDAMDRFGGWYKRNVQLVILAIAVVVTVGLNANTIEVARQIWAQPALRAALSSQATRLAAADKPNALVPTQDASSPDVNAVLGEIDQNLPIGWTTADIDGLMFGTTMATGADGKALKVALSKGERAWAWIKHVAGWLLTVLALSLGAQFWFDTLGKAIGIRAAGPKPSEKQDAAG